LIAYLNDLISNLQEKEQYLRESKEAYKNLVEELNEGIWIVDEDERTTFVNTRMAEMLQATPEEIIGKGTMEIIDPSCHGTILEKMKNRQSGISERYEIILKTLKNRKIYVEISASPSFTPDGKYIGSFGCVTDIPKKEHESKIHELYSSARRKTMELDASGSAYAVNKDLDRIVHERTEEVLRLLEQKNEFFMQLGHDLRTPVTPILALLPQSQ
jgi:PAS domain S-box-containing protein